MDLKDMNQKMDIQKSCIFPPALGESLPGSEVGPLEDPQRPSRTHRKDDLLMDTHPGMVKTMDSDFGKCFNYVVQNFVQQEVSLHLSANKNSMIQVSLHHVLYRLETSTRCGAFIGPVLVCKLPDFDHQILHHFLVQQHALHSNLNPNI